MLKPTEMTIEKAKEMNLGEWDISEKIDGSRTFYFNGNLYSERGINQNHKFPHVLNELKGLDCVLDGELAIENGNVFDLNTKRNWNRAIYFIFDLLFLDGKDIRDYPLEHRINILKDILVKNPKKNIRTPLSFDNLELAWDWVLKNKKEGLVIKRLNSTYPKIDLFTETRKPYWFKIKHIKEKLITFNGFEPHPKGVLLTNKDLRVNLNGLDLSSIAIKEIQQNGSVCASVVYLYQNPSGKLFQPRVKELVINDKVIR